MTFHEIFPWAVVILAFIKLVDFLGDWIISPLSRRYWRWRLGIVKVCGYSPMNDYSIVEHDLNGKIKWLSKRKLSVVEIMALAGVHKEN